VFVQRSNIKPSRYGHLPLTDEDICVAYAKQVTRTVVAEQGLPGIEHCLFLVLYAGDRKCFARISAPKSWCANGGEEDIYPVLGELFQHCSRTNFRLEATATCATVDAFARAFTKRLLEDRFDDRRIANVCVFIAHPDGFGALVSLRGVEWATTQVAKELSVDR
jgi:hypothetical protein